MFYYNFIENNVRRLWLEPRKRKVGCWTAPLPNARQLVWVSRVLGDDHYKRMPRVTVGVAR